MANAIFLLRTHFSKTLLKSIWHENGVITKTFYSFPISRNLTRANTFKNPMFVCIYKGNYRSKLSIGKNKETKLEHAYKDYLFCLKHCFEVSDYIAINISSPNTQDLRELSSEGFIYDLTAKINEEASNLKKTFGKKVPILLKLSPDEDDKNLENIVVSASSNGFDGFILTNTMQGERKGISGGISGELLKDKSLNMLKKVKNIVHDEKILISSGGISTKNDLEERIDNGAKLIQIYTSFVYKGPTIVKELLN